MRASVHILGGPTGCGKTQELWERFAGAARQGLGIAVWLGPTQRTLDQLRVRFRSSLTGFGPQMLTFQDFADRIVQVHDPQSRPLSGPQRRLLTDELLAELNRHGDLPSFERVLETRGFAQAIAALLTELKRNGVAPGSFSRAAERRSLRGEEAEPAPSSVRIADKDRQCARIYAGYQQWLQRLRLDDPEGRCGQARDLLRQGKRSPFDAVRAVFVDGFNDFTPIQHQILEALADGVDELWITLPDEEGDDRAELFTRPRAARRMWAAHLEELTRQQLQSMHAELHGPTGSVHAQDARPAGLVHVERQLFRPLRSVRTSGDAAGLLRIEAPGLLGEARMAAREIKSWLHAGVAADDILVTVRDLGPYAELLREVFGEYGIPIDLEGTEPILRSPAVALLLRALRLPDDGWPFAGVTALLRSGWFRPAWPELTGDPELPTKAEALLRLLGEPRDRQAYLRAIDHWADDPPAPLEDEQAEEPRRLRKHQLALACRPFLKQFFAAWDDAPMTATLAEHIAWLRRFVAELGLAAAVQESPADRLAWLRLWEELEGWERLQRRLRHRERKLDRAQLGRMLTILAAEVGLARTPRGPGRVRILSADLARHLDAPYLVILGLGERSFPRLTAPEPFFDEGERQAFRQAGVDLGSTTDRMADEMLLFYQLVTRARCRLVLSYPAVDERGQELLPSSFLGTLLDCFQPGTVAVQRRRMLIEGYDREMPLSPGEYRVRIARAGSTSQGPPHRLPRTLPPFLRQNLLDAGRLAQCRLRSQDHDMYDGLLRHPAIIRELQESCGPQKVFSPTALEDYIACPFRFLLRHVLRLEELEEPEEGVEHTRRGAAFHRALSRLHVQLQQAGIDRPMATVQQHLLDHLARTVEESIHRAPSLAAKELWRLEGERLRRPAARYVTHWQKFVDLWAELEVTPRPSHFEADFGLRSAEGVQAAPPLVIQVEEIEVRIGGRIDRVDVSEVPGGLAFWIIDYKTGRSVHYTASDLRDFRKLQLTLYALAVERVVLAGQESRPLGLAYWLVTENGPKLAMPASARQLPAWFHDPGHWHRVREQLQRWVATLVAHIRRGDFPLKPRSETCTETCDFGQVCRITQSRAVVENKSWRLPLPIAAPVSSEGTA